MSFAGTIDRVLAGPTYLPDFGFFCIGIFAFVTINSSLDRSFKLGLSLLRPLGFSGLHLSLSIVLNGEEFVEEELCNTITMSIVDL
jgi:hypothetical protein